MWHPPDPVTTVSIMCHTCLSSHGSTWYRFRSSGKGDTAQGCRTGDYREHAATVWVGLSPCPLPSCTATAQARQVSYWGLQVPCAWSQCHGVAADFLQEAGALRPHCLSNLKSLQRNGVQIVWPLPHSMSDLTDTFQFFRHFLISSFLISLYVHRIRTFS